MSVDTSDYARDAFYEQIERELYPEHKSRAIEEFANERLQSYYVANSKVMRPAVDAIQEGRKLQSSGYNAAALVCFVTAIELLLKATLLRPVVFGLVHNEGLAELVVQHLFNQTGFDRYEKLLAGLFAQIAGKRLEDVAREGSGTSLISECTKQQRIRNDIIHKGAGATPEQAEAARAVAVAVYELIVRPVLHALQLEAVEHGEIVRVGA